VQRDNRGVSPARLARLRQVEVGGHAVAANAAVVRQRHARVAVGLCRLAGLHVQGRERRALRQLAHDQLHPLEDVRAALRPLPGRLDRPFAARRAQDGGVPVVL
jgi:hypothetical protein